MTAIKFCGLRTLDDVLAANEIFPEYVGFVFAPNSRRRITFDTADKLRGALSKKIRAVGVFVNADVAAVGKLLNFGTIDIAQLHGSEDAAYIESLRALTSKPIIQAFRVQTIDDVAAAARSSADCVLLDAGAGDGLTFDWRLLKNFPRKYFLAGGLTVDNVRNAIEQLQPFAVDVSSGIEVDGRKNFDRMTTFAEAVRHPSPEPSTRPRIAGKERVDPKHEVSEESFMTNRNGRFGIYGGQYIPETLMNAVLELEDAYNRFKDDDAFKRELDELFTNYAGRPSLLYFARKMTDDLGGAKIYLKREDLNHTGSHKINNVLGQALLAKKMGKRRLIAETGAGQHGVATATAAALLGMECVVFMGVEDTRRQALNVYRMKLLGAKVVPVDSGTGTLKDAVSETFREWTNRIADTHYCLGSVMGPHPFPTIVRDFQAVIGREIKRQLREVEGRLPDVVTACVGGGSNSIGTFYDFIGDKSVRLIGCEAAGRGVDTFETAATIATGRTGIFHGMKSYFCQDAYGQIAPVYSISAGLDYPGIGPEHAHLHDIGRAEYVPVTDAEAVDAFEYLSRTEGIIPAIESAHAVAHVLKLAPTMSRDKIIVITLSGRGDKDCASVARYRGEDISD